MDRTLTARSRSSPGAASRFGLSPDTASDGIPAAVNRAAMNSACSTLTQKASARILRTSATRFASWVWISSARLS